MAGPRKGFGLYRPAIAPTGGGDTNVYHNIIRMAQLGADTVKIPVSWGGRQMHAFPETHSHPYDPNTNGLPPIQTSVYGPWSFEQPGYDDPAQLDKFDQIGFIKTAVAFGRVFNPNLKVIVSFGGPPSDIQGGNNNGDYTTNGSGWSQFGFAGAKVLNALGDICVGIEFGNEPNQKAAGWGGTEIPAAAYGGMAAYLLYWVYSCCGGLDANGDLKKRVLLGSVATSLSNSNMWTENMSPGTWSLMMSGAVHSNLTSLFSSDPVLRDKLFAAWRYSMHPYPRLGSVQSGLPPSHPSNTTGDTTGAMAADTVWNSLQDYHGMFSNRKIWITETGVSSSKLTETGQRDFHNLIGYRAMDRYSANDKRLEGVINWGFSDLDPGVYTSGVGDPYNSQAAFYKLGVLKDIDGTTAKLAGVALENIYKNWWV